MAGPVPAIHVFIGLKLPNLILRSRCKGRLEGGSRECWNLLRDADYVCPSG